MHFPSTPCLDLILLLPAKFILLRRIPYVSGADADMLSDTLLGMGAQSVV
jgi:hypothetical protein